MSLTTAPKTGHATFLYSELATDLDHLQADIAFLGIPYGDAYSFAEIVNDQTNMPAAMRRATDRIVRSIERYDFDLGGPLYDGRPIRTVDCGDIIGDFRDLTAHYVKAEAAIRKIRASGAMPIVLGGDHGVPIPVLRALDGDGPITLIQIDQHLDWRQEVNGVTTGYSSPIRRASEMAHVGEIFQIGLHGTGSARIEEVEAARAYGAQLVTSYEVHERGMQAVLDRIPAGGRYYLTIDLDGIDPAIAPGVAGPCPGGLTFPQVRTLIHGLVGKGRVVGMDVVEITPRSDVNQITCITAGRFVVNMIGAAVRAGYFDKATS
ncbi:agmatinase [Bosea sp. RAC05]|jgi:agmatinase|uniref:agmatinase n=1 Tax=Bosea sp. RAC05 TaxID=1842539 RepID=UPI00083CE77A|nr:agmatinase [Bosea sp. RAC05]AOG05821.1 arginase family protein [Bosea sp. RAC05]